MAVDVLRRAEAIPAAYPAVPTGVSTAAAALDPDMIWARIEAYVAYRWTARQVIWTVQGPGEWTPDLTPATITATEVWESDAWTADTFTAGPMGGYVLDGGGPYRITADVGSGTVPAAINEAFRRLAEYLAADPGTAGASSTSVAIGPIQETLDRNPNWVARAMQNSGAGDLLRNYRRA